jgi:sugar lactone lactonase YvrE
MKAEILYATKCILGESPLWHPERRSCFWVDIEKGILYEYNQNLNKLQSWQFKEKLSLVIVAKSGRLLLALNTKIALFDLESEQLQWLLDVEPSSSNRCNDGACDSMGRLWVGTMHLQHKAGSGALYCIDQNLGIHKKLPATTISNGIAWSRDNKRLYYIDSPTRVVQSFIFGEKTGDIVFEKNVIEIPADMGSPDGMALDEEGMLWIAQWGGFGVFRWNPHNGKLMDRIELPVPQVSSCAFAGEGLDYLLITTASENMSEHQLEKYPESGNTFFVKAPVKGNLPSGCVF